MQPSPGNCNVATTRYLQELLLIFTINITPFLWNTFSGVATLSSSRQVPMDKFDSFFLNQCSTFLLEYACRYVPGWNLYCDINVQSANYHVNNTSNYWKISLYFVFLETLDHLVEDRSKRGVNNKKVDFVVEVEHWKIRWALVDEKTDRLLDTLHASNHDLYPAIYSIISNYWQCWCHWQQARYISMQWDAWNPT